MGIKEKDHDGIRLWGFSNEWPAKIDAEAINKAIKAEHDKRERVKFKVPVRLMEEYKQCCRCIGKMVSEDIEDVLSIAETLPSEKAPEIIATSCYLNDPDENHIISQHLYIRVEGSSREDKVYEDSILKDVWKTFVEKCENAQVSIDDEIKLLMKARCHLDITLEDSWATHDDYWVSEDLPDLHP